jgi:hypothetical protein
LNPQQFSKETHLKNRQPGVPNFPKIVKGTLIWRPCLVHVSRGITPLIMDLRARSSIDEDGFARTLGTIEARAVWGDLDKLGCSPEHHGWRVSRTAPKGMRIQIRTPVPPDWTHVIAQNFEDYDVASAPDSAEETRGLTRRMAKCIPYNTGREDLYKMLVDYYSTQTEWESDELHAVLDKMLNKQLFNDNFDRLKTYSGVETM